MIDFMVQRGGPIIPLPLLVDHFGPCAITRSNYYYIFLDIARIINYFMAITHKIKRSVVIFMQCFYIVYIAIYFIKMDNTF